MKVYNLGSLNIDYVYKVEHFVRPGETLSSADMQIFPGGKGLNQSVALARAGAAVVHGAVLGANGGFLLDTLRSSGVDAGSVKTVDQSSGHAIIQVDRSGQNCILLFAGTNHMLTEEYIADFLADAQPGDLLLMQNETNGIHQAFEIAHEKGMQIAFNPSPFQESILELPLSYVNWWFCNEIEAQALFGSGTPEQLAQRFSEQYPDSNLVLTLGQDGSMFKNKDICCYQPIFKVDVVDTTAAGDTFTGFFLASIAGGESVQRALQIASTASGIAVSRPGASASIPLAEEVIL